MSKGLGHMERSVLGALDGGRQLTMYGVMLHVFGGTQPFTTPWDTPPIDATSSQKVSLRRAVRSLERRGLVETRDSRENPGYGRLHRKLIRKSR